MPHRWRPFTLSIDDTSQIQARDRTQPGLPLKKGRGATMTHDYKRNGTTTLFAALTCSTARSSASTPVGIATRSSRDAATASRARYPPASRSMPSSTTTPLTSTRTSRAGSHAIRAGPSTSPPTSSAWLNALEGVFAKLTRRRLKYGVFRSVRELQDAIRRVIDEHNTTEARPFVWTADPDTIIAARKREVQMLKSIH